MAKILITGANGFLGTHLSSRLLEQGHTVYGLVRNPKKIVVTHPQFVVIKGDLNSAKLSWIDFLPDDLEVCIHTAGLVHSYQTDDFNKVNAEGLNFLLEALKNKSNLINSFKFILISSLASAGPVSFGEMKQENDPDFPVSYYGRSKKAAEEILKLHAPKNWIISIIRPPMIIGPGDTAVLDIFKMVKSRIIILPGINSKIKEYSFVCVYDLVDTIILVYKSNKSHFLYIAHDDVITFLELVNQIKKCMKIKVLFYLPIPILLIRWISKILAFVHQFFNHNLRLTPDKIFELEGSAWVCQNIKSKTILAQEYNYPIKKTIEVTYEDYCKRKWL